MPAYQFYRLARGGTHSEVTSLVLFDDRAAVRWAVSDAFPHGCDVWQGPRFVGRMHRARPDKRDEPPTLCDAP